MDHFYFGLGLGLGPEGVCTCKITGLGQAAAIGTRTANTADPHFNGASTPQLDWNGCSLCNEKLLRLKIQCLEECENLTTA
jgi:hypothetical protein